MFLDAGEGAGDEREEGLVLALEDVPAVLERGDGGVARGQRGVVPRLQRQEHEVDPHARRPRAHGEQRARVQAVQPAPPARELQPRLLLAAPLLDGALGGRRQAQRHVVHVRLDLVQVLLAEVLHGVAHGVGLEHADAVVGRARAVVRVDHGDAGVVGAA